MDLQRLQKLIETMTKPHPSIRREETCSPAATRRIAAMLDLDLDEIAAARFLPRGWQFFLMAADTRRSALRSDGFPGLGVPMPDLGLPRLMLGGRTVVFNHDIPIGASVERSSAVESVTHKTTDSGPMAIVKLAHELRIPGRDDAALIETQTYLLLSPVVASADRPAPPPGSEPISAEHSTTVVPDETLLFQYSALGFNTHKIHLDRDHARDVEGFPDLVVNGGLATLLMTEYLRRDLGVVPTAIKTRHVAPLFCNRPFTLTADPKGAHWQLRAFDDGNRLAIDMEVTAQ
jgi:3-methylfumaryl-CoA hydratase